MLCAGSAGKSPTYVTCRDCGVSPRHRGRRDELRGGKDKANADRRPVYVPQRTNKCVPFPVGVLCDGALAVSDYAHVHRVQSNLDIKVHDKRATRYKGGILRDELIELPAYTCR
jgi:hypothetical protein